MSRVLILEDEPMLRNAMVRGLGRMPGVHVTDASCFSQALEFIDCAAPDLVLSDIDLPDRSGIEILGELGRRGLRIPVVFISGFLKAYRAQIPQHANVIVLEKPIAIDELRQVVRERLPQNGDAPEPSPFSVPDYLQLAAMGRRSMVLEVRGPTEENGQIVVHDGELWFVSDHLGNGLEALGRLAFLPNARVACRTLGAVPPERNVESSIDGALLEAARLLDEASKLSIPPTSLDASPTSVDALSLDEAFASHPPPAPNAEQEQGTLLTSLPPPPGFEDAWDKGIAALLRKDYDAAYGAFYEAAALRPEDMRVQVNLRRLEELGCGGSKE